MSELKRDEWGHTIETIRLEVEYDVSYNDEPDRCARPDAIKSTLELPMGFSGCGPAGSYGTVQGHSRRVKLIGGQADDPDDPAVRLRAYLRTINVCRELEELLHIPGIPYSGPVADGLYALKDRLGESLETNEELQVFDQVFADAGWAAHGIRWTREDDDPEVPEDTYLVTFTNDQHTEWEIL